MFFAYLALGLPSLTIIPIQTLKLQRTKNSPYTILSNESVIPTTFPVSNLIITLLPIRYADNFYKRAGRGRYIVLSHLLRGMDQEINRV